MPIRPPVLSLLLAAAIAAPAGLASASVTKIKIDPPGISGTVTCPLQQVFIAKITSTAAGNVTFEWTTSDGQHSPVQTAVFAAPGVQPVSYLWMATADGARMSGRVHIQTLSPNWVQATARVSANCRHATRRP